MEYDVNVTGLLLAFIRCEDRESREKLLDRWEEITGIAISEETKKEYKEWVSRSYPVRRRTRKWNDEKLMKYDVEDLKRDTESLTNKIYKKGIFARYTKLTGISISEETEEEYKARISKAHSGPRKRTDEKLMSYKDDVPSLRNALSTCDKSRREKLLARYTELTGIVVSEETEEERKERISKACSKPKKSGWTDERIMSYATKEELKKVIKNRDKSFRERVLTRWDELREHSL